MRNNEMKLRLATMLSVVFIGIVIFFWANYTNIAIPSSTSTVSENNLSAEDTVNKYMTYLKEKNYTNISNLVSSRFYTVKNLTPEKLIAAAENTAFSNPFTTIDYKIASINDIDDNTKYFTVLHKYKTPNSTNELTETLDFVAIKENDCWKLNLGSFIETINYEKSTGSTESGKLNILLTKENKFIDGSVLSLEIINNSPNDYSFGFAKDSIITVVTDLGTFSNKIGVKIPKETTDSITIGLNGLKGDIQTVKIDSIVKLNDRGLPYTIGDSGFKYIVYKK